MKKPSNKSVIWLLVVAILLVTAFGIWVVHQVFETVEYKESCLQKPFNEVPSWCWEELE